jgi:hypothetical protein
MHILKGALVLAALFIGFKVGVDAAMKYSPATTAPVAS